MTTQFVKTKIETPKAKYIKYSEAKKGDILVVGEFLGTKEVDNYNKDGKVPSHSFKTDEGLVVLNSSKSLDRILAGLEAGLVLEVTFQGKTNKVSKDGKKYRQNEFEVSILEEQE